MRRQRRRYGIREEASAQPIESSPTHAEQLRGRLSLTSGQWTGAERTKYPGDPAFALRRLVVSFHSGLKGRLSRIDTIFEPRPDIDKISKPVPWTMSENCNSANNLDLSRFSPQINNLA